MSTLIAARSTSCRPTLPAITRLERLNEDHRELLNRWRGLADSTVGCPVELHPSYLCGADDSSTCRARGVLVSLACGQGNLPSLAVLLEKHISLPVLPGRRWGIPLRGLRLTGSRLLGDDSADCSGAFAARVGELFEKSCERYQALLVEDLPTDSPLWDAFRNDQRVWSVVLTAPQTRWLIQFPRCGDDYWKQFSSKTRYNFRRQKRLFEHSWEVVREPSQVALFLREASAISVRSWQGRRIGPRVRGDGAEIQHFRRLAEISALRCYLLRSGDQPAAFAIGTQWQGRFVLEEIGYDPQFAKYSPGTVLLLNMLDDMLQIDRPELFDFGLGDGEYKRLFGNQAHLSGSLLVVARDFGGTVAVAASWARTRLEQFARWGLRAVAADRWARRFFRRVPMGE